MKPNLFLLGAAKSGTTALASFLGEHPQIFLSVSKEPGWFATDYRRGGGRGETTLRSFEDYEALFAEADRIPGIRYALDASTVYLKSDVALEAILDYAPEARILVILRDPVAMAQAFHMEALFNLNEDVEDFETAWRLQERRARGEAIPPGSAQPKRLQYRTVCAVGSQLEKVWAQVAPERRLVLFHEDYVADAGALWKDLLRFLELDPAPDIDLSRRVGAAHFNRSRALAKVYRHPLITPLRHRATALLRRTGTLDMAKRALARSAPRPALAADFEAELRAEFLPEVEKIEALTGRALGHWKPLPEALPSPLPAAP